MLDRSLAREADFPPLDYTSCHPTELLERIRQAQVVGMGGAGYPTYQKLQAGIKVGIKHVIANGVECEPGAQADVALLKHYLNDVLLGLQIVGRVLLCDDLTLAVTKGLDLPASATVSLRSVSVATTEDHPGAGEERALIYSVLNQVVPRDRYPTDFGIVVLSVATLFAICEAVRDGRKPRDRIVTVFGEPRWVKAGTSVDSFTDGQAPLRVGTLVTGRIATPQAKVELTHNALSVDRMRRSRACIHCGWCNQVCPRSLNVEAMHRFGHSSLDTVPDHLAEHYDNCYECGACVVECPSEIQLLDSIRNGRQKLETTRKKRRSDIRFQQRADRLANRERDENAARAERMQNKRTW